MINDDKIGNSLLKKFVNQGLLAFQLIMNYELIVKCMQY